MQADNFFGGMKDTELSKKGTYLTDGIFRLRVKSTERVDFRDGVKKGYAVTVEVIETPDPVKHPVGSERSYFVTLRPGDDGRKMFMQSVKSFIVAALGYDAKVDEEKIKSELDPKIEQLALASTQNKALLAGREVICEVKSVPKKSKPTEMFSRHTFSPAK
jgi:hypothetical protein